MPLLLDGDDVLDGAVFGVARHLPRAQLPAEARPPEQVERRLVLLHLGRRDQGGEDDPGLAAVDDVVVLVAQVRAAVPERHRRGVGIGRADAEIGRAPVGAARLGAVGAPSLPDPVVALRRRCSASSACAASVSATGNRAGASPPSSSGIATSPRHHRRPAARGEEVGEVRLDGEARAGASRGRRWPRPWWRRCRAPGPRPTPPRGTARRSPRRSAEDLQPVALPDAGQAGVVGERLGQVVAEVPAQAEPVGDHPHELALGAQPLEEQDQLQLEEDDRVDRGPPDVRRRHPAPGRARSRDRASAPGAGRSESGGTRSSSDTGGSGPKARSFVPIMAGRSSGVAVKGRSGILSPERPFFNRLDSFLKQRPAPENARRAWC